MLTIRKYSMNLFIYFFFLGVHNFHHVFPWDYKASEWKSLFSNTTTWIDMFAKIGWAYDLKRVSPEYIKLVVQRRGDGTHKFFDE